MKYIDNLIARRPVVLPNDATIYEAARTMAAQSIGCIILANPGRDLLGIVTDRDLALRALTNDFMPDAPVLQVATKELVTVEQGTTIKEAVSLMVEFGIRRLPVVEELSNGRLRCVGVVSADDLMISGELNPDQVQDIIASQVSRTGGVSFPETGRAQRRAGHKAETFYKFMAEILHRDKACAKDFTLAALKLVMRRILYSEAIDLVSQLPRKVQEELLTVPPGPDKRIDSQRFVIDLAYQTGLQEDEVAKLLPVFWVALEMYLGEDSEQEGELSHVLSQLPADIEDLFKPRREGSRPLAARRA